MCTRALIAAAAAAVVLGLAAVPARAQAQFETFFYNSDNPNAAARDNAVVGYGNQADLDARANGTSPTVDFTSGSFSRGLSTYNASDVTYRGNRISLLSSIVVTTYDSSSLTVSRPANITSAINANSTFNVRDRSTLTFDAGVRVTGRVSPVDNSTVNVAGAFVDTNVLQPGGNCTVNMTDGSLGPMRAYGRTTMNISGGAISYIDAYDSATINISGGTFEGGVECWGQNTVNVTGGSSATMWVNFFNHGSGSATLNYSGGSFAFLSIGGLSGENTANITGGRITRRVSALEYGTVNISGGTFRESSPPSPPQPFDSVFFANNGGVLNIFGTNLTLTPILLDPYSYPGSFYALSGTLQDGSPVSNAHVYLAPATGNLPAGRIVLNNIPDPAVLPVALPLVILGRRRRRFR